MDNCTTFHVCKDKFLFIGEIRPCPNIRVKGVSGIAIAAGIGTIRFTITSKTGEHNEITLDNVIYLPESPKNLISISRWSRDRGDDCGILSRGEYSIFLWDNDNSQKLIHHTYECPIPIMTVNEGDDPVQTFISGNEDAFVDHLALFNDGPPHQDLLQLQPDKLDECEILVDQQPTKKSLHIPKGITVRWHSDNRVKLCEMISNESKNRMNTCKVKILGTQDVITLPLSSVEPVCAPDPSVMPEDISDFEVDVLQDIVSQEDLKAIWDKVDTTYTDDTMLFFYWHRRTRHFPMKYVKRLAPR